MVPYFDIILMTPMLRTILSWFGIALVGLAYFQIVRPQPLESPAALVAAPHRALLDRYCVTCHNQKLKTAGLMLDRADLDKVTEEDPLWEKILGKLRAGAMPPAGMPRPEKSAVEALVKFLETELDRAAAIDPNPGRPTALHRLNRAEYTNVIRDLLGIDSDAFNIPSLLPPDDSGYGFDNKIGRAHV